MATHSLEAGSPWYVLRVQAGIESVVSERIYQRDIEVFNPQYSEMRRYSHWKPTEIRRALFTGYVFGRFVIEERGAVLNVPGVIDILSFGSTPATVPHIEIENLRIVVDSGLAEPWNLLKVGQQVTITRGPFAGTRGRLVEIKNKLRFIVGVELFNRGVSVEVESGMLAA
jgi:transcriptional antiterminator RfaH